LAGRVRGRSIDELEETAVSDKVAAELAHLRETVEMLTQGLRMMVETQDTHTEMLQAILEAATEEAGESPLPGLLEQIVGRLDEQTSILHRIEAAASGGPADDTQNEEWTDRQPEPARRQ
jgi:hypothetical protein